MRIEVPALSLIVLVGASGSGKSTFARKHFKGTEIVSSDACRGVVDDDENSLEATNDAFELVHFIVAKRLKRGKLTVVDATNVQPDARAPLIELARRFHAVPVAIVIDTPEQVCHARNAERPDRQFGPHVVRNHVRQLKRSLGSLRRERFRYTTVLKPDDLDRVEVVRIPLWTDRREERGPFDVVGDVHGCFDELLALLTKLGYTVDPPAPVPRPMTSGRFYTVVPPEGRRAVFLGDLVDRGPDSPSVLRLAMDMVASGTALCVPGNHDEKLSKKLAGKDVQVRHGLEQTLEQLDGASDDALAELRTFLDGMVSHLVLDEGRIVVAHAGMREDMQGRASSAVRSFALYGETTGETDDFGLPVRFDWASEYRGKAKVVYGHTPVVEPEWLNRTINVDTGCVFGGRLTALRYPEGDTVSVAARETYSEPSRPIVATGGLSAQHELDDVLDVGDVTGKWIVSTGLAGNLTVWPEQSAAALEVMSRFAVNPKWLVYLPPTMSPCATSDRPGFLEYPLEAFSYFRSQGVGSVVCEEKHMGSRAVVVVCRDETVAMRRFGIEASGCGIVTTRTGRAFFDSPELNGRVIDRLRNALEVAGTWDVLGSDWAVLDCELMPWSAKAKDLLVRQYAPTGAAALAASRAARDVLQAASGRGVSGLDADQQAWEGRAQAAEKFIDAYRRYCWPVSSIDDYRLAPFHILASEGVVHTDKPHVWHMETSAAFCAHDPLFVATRYRTVDLGSEQDVKDTCQWWEDLVARGGEGMVVKPSDFLVRGARGIVQPAVKCRGPEYLRIIYGPEYLAPQNLDRLRKRGISRKQSLSQREFVLGIEGLQRFVDREPLRRVHQCVFAVLATESTPVDPRL
ncbi:MAG: polynucleotide kinase-phosphatase [Armatimonadetes bacterium]|nr:polynucleotide kinase-phosphatase [Armatimonadota bacterium]